MSSFLLKFNTQQRYLLFIMLISRVIPYSVGRCEGTGDRWEQRPLYNYNV